MFDEPLACRGIDDHRQQTVLQGIAAEDVGDLRADDSAKAVIQECPRGMFARGAAAEVAARDEDAAIARIRTVENEVVPRSVGVISPVGEEMLAEAIARGR